MSNNEIMKYYVKANPTTEFGLPEWGVYTPSGDKHSDWYFKETAEHVAKILNTYMIINKEMINLEVDKRT